MKKDAILWVLGGIGIWFLYQRYKENLPLIFEQVGGESSNEPGFFDSAMEVFQPDLETMDEVVLKNRRAFLAVIRATEGTDQYTNPYAVIFGGRELDPPDMSDHPGNIGFSDWVHFTDKNGKDNWSTASGAYQFKLSTWNRLREKLGLTDFSSDSQDLAALELIREVGALSDVDKGNVIGAVYKTNRIWASFPGAPYGQPTKSESFVQNAFNNALG